MSLSKMLSSDPLQMSRLLLAAFGTRMDNYYLERIPKDGTLLVVSNHRSFMDAPLLMTAVNRPVRFACHHYMGQVPVLREIVNQFGCFPLKEPQQRQQSFFQQAVQLLRAHQMVGVFPEGAEPMVQETSPNEVGEFQRGFAHLALRAPIENLAILPVAIASQEEVTNSAIPLQLFSWIDPSEPLFNQSGWHPMVVYQRVNILIGRPYRITPVQQKDYQGKQARSLVAEITESCQTEIHGLLTQGCY
jgi:1-acyl-sn-glycerol-3-phosphate acyltransferase